MASLIDTPTGPVAVTPGACVGIAVPGGWLPPKREVAGKAPPQDGLPPIRVYEDYDAESWYTRGDGR